jgi:hypothetical protein
MTIQYSTALRNAQLDAIETVIGASPKLRIYAGSVPAAVADAATGTLVAELTLPSDWLAAAASGSKAKAGTWSGSAGASGTASYFRILDSAGTTTIIQGTVGTSSADLIVDSTSFNNGQAFSVTAFTITTGEA